MSGSLDLYRIFMQLGTFQDTRELHWIRNMSARPDVAHVCRFPARIIGVEFENKDLANLFEMHWVSL